VGTRSPNKDNKTSKSWISGDISPDLTREIAILGLWVRFRDRVRIRVRSRVKLRDRVRIRVRSRVKLRDRVRIGVRS
jgi:hypothetical protein